MENLAVDLGAMETDLSDVSVKPVEIDAAPTPPGTKLWAISWGPQRPNEYNPDYEPHQPSEEGDLGLPLIESIEVIDNDSLLGDDAAVATVPAGERPPLEHGWSGSLVFDEEGKARSALTSVRVNFVTEEPVTDTVEDIEIYLELADTAPPVDLALDPSQEYQFAFLEPLTPDKLDALVAAQAPITQCAE